MAKSLVTSLTIYGLLATSTNAVPYPDNLDDTTVTKVKLLAAEMAEILKKDYENERGPLKSLLFDHALGEIINAQMSVVKVITLKNK